MDFNFKLLDKIDNLVKLTNDFDSGFKIVFDLDPNDKLDEKNIEILYSITKNYILIRKEHGELLLMMNKLMNTVNMDNINNSNEQQKSKKTNKNNSQNNNNSDSDLGKYKLFYEISTFNTLLSNANDLINNIDYEYKKIAIKYPKFINKSRITMILIIPENDDKYDKLINELKSEYPENNYKIIKCGNKKNEINKCEKELEEYGIKIKSTKSLPKIYIINNSTISEIPLSKIDSTEEIKNLIE